LQSQQDAIDVWHAVQVRDIDGRAKPYFVPASLWLF